MKNTTILFFAVYMWLYGSSGIAAPSLSSIADIMQQREQKFSHLTWDWRVNFHASYAGNSPTTTLIARKNLEKAFTEEYKRRGFTDEKKILKMSEARVHSVLSLSNNEALTTSTSWRFARDGQSVLVTGAYPVAHGVLPRYREYFSGENGLIVNDPASDAPLNVTNDPFVWASPGESVRYRTPYPLGGLALEPEDFALLAGYNVLNIYGAQWTLKSATDQEWVLQSHVKPPDGGFVTYTVTLSAKYNGAISEIQVKSEDDPSSQDWRVVSYRHYGNEWVGNKVDFHASAPGIADVVETYDLQATTASSSPIIVNVAQGLVQDYRLLGNNLTQDAVLRADAQQRPEVVLYKWTGQFPNLDELKKIEQQQHPGESLPDPGKSSSLPFVGGLMALIGGVWLFKRRGGLA